MNTVVDHLVVAAATLEQGARWCRETLGVEPGPGGRHALMGTHNRLLKVATGVFEDAYLEIIAIDPSAPAPSRARWFGLDEPALQARLRAQPRLVHVVARTSALGPVRHRLQALGADPGEALSANRDTPEGLLSWQITVPADGRPLCGGALPTLIQWQGRHPAGAMPSTGIALERLVLHGLDPRVAEELGLPGVEFAAGAAGGALAAVLQTARGPVTLKS